MLGLCALLTLTSGCGPAAENDAQTPSAQADATPTDRFDGTWKVDGRTGNEDGSNTPVCGKETGTGTVTISGNRVAGNIANASGFEYTVEGTVDNQGNLKAMLKYQEYDAAELMGTFTDTTAKGNWSDAVNACPGVWTARKQATEPVQTVSGETPPAAPAPEPPKNSG